MGLSPAKSGRWGEVGIVVFVVTGLGMWIGYKLGFGPILFKITTVASAIAGLISGLKLRNWILVTNAARIDKQKSEAAVMRESETQCLLAGLRARKNKNKE